MRTLWYAWEKSQSQPKEVPYENCTQDSIFIQQQLLESLTRRKEDFKKKLSNDPTVRSGQHLKPFQKEIAGIVVESTYNWYWLVDGLMEEGYKVHLANPSAIQKYTGLKHADDKHDAFWLAEMLRLGILPEGYIYPKEERPMRDLLRKRGHLVRLRTSLIISLQNIISRNCGIKLNGDEVKGLKRSCNTSFGGKRRPCFGRQGQQRVDRFSDPSDPADRRVVERRLAQGALSVSSLYRGR